MDVEIHAQTAFSFLRGASLPEDLVARAVALGYRSVAVLDRDGVYGAPRFYKAAKEAGLHAIVGAALAVDTANVRGVLGLYVQSRTGYQNLCRLITLAKLRIPKERARADGITVSLDELAAHKEGLAVLFLAHEAPLVDIPRGRSPGLGWVRAIVGVFGRAQCFMEQGRHFHRDELRTMARLAHLADALKIRGVASNDVRYATPEASSLADIFTCARTHTTLDSVGTRLDANAERYFKPPAEMTRLFRDAPGYIANAHALAESCAFTLENLGYRFPDYPLPPGQTSIGYLQHLVQAGARIKYPASSSRVTDQIAHELGLIEKLGFEGYFLIVKDIVDFCRARGILVQGRGSAANSIVCFVLGITAIDPIQYGLLFERFLSESRGEWPDIDMDLPSGDRREEVIQYVYQRFGERGAAMTANVITYRPRSAVREVGKALGFPEEMLAKFARQLGWGAANREDLTVRLEAAGVSARDRRVALLVDNAWRLLNLPRHLGQHSGGMVIAAGRLDEVTPLEPASMPNRVVVQWDKDDCANLGILKVDLLGLGMMALLEEVFPLMERADGASLTLDTIPPDDPKTYAMLQQADTVGVFQVESRAQMATLPRLKPKKFYDLVVEVAIIRPGPIVGKMLHPYLKRHAGREAITYPHPSLEPILERTLGVPLFQEQLMRVAMVAADFTGAQAEELRRAMGSKRSVDRMNALEAQLRQGMTKNHYAQQAQDDVVQGIKAFALYGFPESHAASFALLAYASAYIKCHYPASFACALLNHWPMGFYHPATVVKDAQRHGVRPMPISVVHSDWLCTREPGNVLRLGLRYAGGVREATARAIERARGVRAFEGIEDLARRSGARDDEMTVLAELGALAELPKGGEGDARWTRRSALWQVLNLAARPKGDLFARARVTEDPDMPLDEMSLSERVAADYRNSGLTVGPHPMKLVRGELEARGVLRIDRFLVQPDGVRVTVAGAVITRQRPETAKGFFFLTLEDETGIANAIVSPKLFEQERNVMVTSPLLVLHGVVQQQDDVTSLKVTHAEALQPARVRMRLPEGHDFH